MNQKVSASTVHGKPLSVAMLQRMDAWWRAANYLSVGQIYLRDNPLLQRIASKSATLADCGSQEPRR